MKSSIKVIKRMQFRPHYSSPWTEGRSPYWSLPWAAICGTHPSNNTHTHTSVPTFCSALLSSKLTDSLHLLCIHFSDPEVTSIFYRVYGCICGSLLAELSCLYGINSPTSDQNQSTSCAEVCHLSKFQSLRKCKISLCCYYFCFYEFPFKLL